MEEKYKRSGNDKNSETRSVWMAAIEAQRVIGIISLIYITFSSQKLRFAKN